MTDLETNFAQQRLLKQLAGSYKLTPATLNYVLTGGKWIPAAHLMYISKIIAPAIAKGGARIILTMPARHGKSEFLSVATPIWFLEKYPDKFSMGLSYGLDLATDFSVRVRETFLNEDNHHLLNTRISKKRQKVERFLTTKGGGHTAAGLGGIITGRGADLMLIDDYTKNAEQALSETQNKNLWEWFKSTAYTRLEPGASLVVLATRWGRNDLIGKLLTDMPDENWVVINLPALAEINDPLGREVGEPLWPERYSREQLLKMKKAVGSYWWEAMYQQNPKASMSGADVGEKLKYVDRDKLPHHSEIKWIRAWDMAATEDDGDYTAGPKIGYHKKSRCVYIDDIQHFQKGPFGVETMIHTVAEKDGHGVKIWAEQEPGSAGVTVATHYKNNVLGSFNVGFEKATGPAEVRAGPLIAAIEAGNVYVVKSEVGVSEEAPNGEVNRIFKEELNSFPDGDHDDLVIATALGYNKLAISKFGSVVWGSRAGQTKSNVIQMPTPSQVKRVSKVTW